jgi:AhpC/TSA family
MPTCVCLSPNQKHKMSDVGKKGSVLADFKVGKLNGDEVNIASRYSQKPCLILIVRRPGCQMCRQQAAIVSTFRANIKEFGVEALAIFKDAQGVDDFKPTFWRDEIVLESKLVGRQRAWHV